jgi:hypothetical protein
MKNFIFVGKRNRDWYFTERTNDVRCEEIQNIYFSKDNLISNNKLEYLDYIPEVDVYMFI